MTPRISGLVARALVERDLANLDRRWRALERAPQRPRALHKHREACQRLHAAVGLLAGFLDDRAIDALETLASKPKRGTGRFRDADVHARRLARPEAEKPAPAALVDALGRIGREGRKRALARAARRARRVEPRIRDALAEVDPEARAEPLARSTAAARAAVLAAAAHGWDDATLHGARIALKRLRFALEALAPALDGDALDVARRAAEETHDVTRLLGIATDARAFAERFAENFPAEGPLGEAFEAERADMEARGSAARTTFLEGLAADRWPTLRETLGLDRLDAPALSVR
ncbi:MAG TPA: CHAD domain-containing protein [Candidatus Thermoplasmatota archaeon]|nr:CHAD domain-containing protein [Candidatus Thermoplasmatota archaeon]